MERASSAVGRSSSPSRRSDVDRDEGDDKDNMVVVAVVNLLTPASRAARESDETRRQHCSMQWQRQLQLTARDERLLMAQRPISESIHEGQSSQWRISRMHHPSESGATCVGLVIQQGTNHKRGPGGSAQQARSKEPSRRRRQLRGRKARQGRERRTGGGDTHEFVEIHGGVGGRRGKWGRRRRGCRGRRNHGVVEAHGIVGARSVAGAVPQPIMSLELLGTPKSMQPMSPPELALPPAELVARPGPMRSPEHFSLCARRRA